MELRQLVAAGALANARTFGGEDYVGFHTMMALAPGFHIAQELPPHGVDTEEDLAAVGALLAAR